MLKVKIERQKDKNAQMAGEVKMLRKRELEIVKRWDFDDIDLVTDRLWMINGHAASESKWKIKIPSIKYNILSSFYKTTNINLSIHILLHMKNNYI